MMRVAINGLGRIGRATFKILVSTPELELVAINDLAPPTTWPTCLITTRCTVGIIFE
jgi:glyceraldehyde-3-phosphate dehydrogenase/erythrose-4-phosphate dehydrogenase